MNLTTQKDEQKTKYPAIEGLFVIRKPSANPDRDPNPQYFTTFFGINRAIWKSVRVGVPNQIALYGSAAEAKAVLDSIAKNYPSAEVVQFGEVLTEKNNA